MRNTIAMLAMTAAITLVSAGDTFAAGRVSRFAALQQLKSPFDTIAYSSYSASAFGLPVFAAQSSDPAPAVSTPSAASELGELTAPSTTFSSTSTRPPFRPRVRSPFRPPPRPSFP